MSMDEFVGLFMLALSSTTMFCLVAGLSIQLGVPAVVAFGLGAAIVVGGWSALLLLTRNLE